MYITQVFFLLHTCYISYSSRGTKHSGVKLWCPDKADDFWNNIHVRAVKDIKDIENYLT